MTCRANLTGWTNSPHAIVDALPSRTELPHWTRHAYARRFSTEFGAWIAGQSGCARQTRAFRHTSAIFTSLVRGTRDAHARFDADSNATNLPMRTNHIGARGFADAHRANFASRTRHFFACRINAESGARTNQRWRTNEFAAATFLNAFTLVTDETHRAYIAFVRRAITIVVESITGFCRGRNASHAIDAHGCALRNALPTNAGLPSVTCLPPARAGESLEEIHVIVVIAIIVERRRSRTDIAIFECQVKRIWRNFRDIGDCRNP